MDYNPEETEQELDFESIMREFSDLPGEDLPETEPEIQPETEPETEPAEEPAEEPEVSGQSAVTGDTIRMDISSLPKGSYDGAQHIDDEAEEAEEEILNGFLR